MNLFRRNGEAATQGIDRWLAMYQPSSVNRLKTIMSELREAHRQHSISARSNSSSVNCTPQRTEDKCVNLLSLQNTHVQDVEMKHLVVPLFQFCLHQSLGKEYKKQNGCNLM